MSRLRPLTRGDDLAARLDAGVREAEAAPLPGARDLPALRGMSKDGKFEILVENVVIQLAAILVASGRVFALASDVVMATDGFGGGSSTSGQRADESTTARLVTLRGGDRVEPGAENQLANLFVCEQFVKGQVIQFSPTRGLVELVLRSETALRCLLRIRQYARTPVYDTDFILRGPGWYPGPGVLVHGPAVDPALVEPGDPALPALERLPRHLRDLLAGFCFAADADLVNAVAVLVTGLLVNHFVVPLKPLVLLDGNQPGVGKTLLARTVGLVLTGTDPRLIPYTPDDDELGKKVCATLRGGQAGVLIFDNAKAKGGVLESVVVESNSMAPEVSIRVLGVSENYTRPNDIIWCLTMNSTRASPDLVSRALPVRLAYEGDPGGRAFAGPDPIEYARGHRLELLGELAGLVELWKRRGRPDGAYSHRCGYWARVVGGVLAAAGLPEFLSNVGEAVASFDTTLDDLAALAEAAIAVGAPFILDITLPAGGGEAR